MSFPYSEWLPALGQARGVQIDIDRRMIGMRCPPVQSLRDTSAQKLSDLGDLALGTDRPLADEDRNLSRLS
jgi:hypothetical protein